VTTQPSLIAAMVAALGLTGGERVLEVGTGLGFQTAILARLARQVVSIERLADLAAQARANLAAAGVVRVTVVVGDGTLGVPEHAPYQAIVVSAASPWVPGPLVEQLTDGGRLVHPVGPGGHEQVTAFSRQADRLVVEARLVPARFVPLVGAYGTPAREGRGEP
jgi:protein-L-isoaspartate(D-aspartate) O-methyltransferase